MTGVSSSRSQRADEYTTSEPLRYQKPPTVSTTGLGYHYVRCQRGDHDETVYIHQLCAIAGGADPEDVFSSHWDVHHKPLHEWLDLDEPTPPTPIEVGDVLVPPLDVPRGVKLEPKNEHRKANLEPGAAD